MNQPDSKSLPGTAEAAFAIAQALENDAGKLQSSLLRRQLSCAALEITDFGLKTIHAPRRPAQWPVLR